MMAEVRRTFDVCLLDAPAGVGAGFQMAARAASSELLVTGPDPGALRDGARTGEILELMGKRDVRLVVNRVNPKLYRSMGLTVDDVMDLVGYPLLGLVPEDRNVTLAAVHDRPLLQYARAESRGRRLPPDVQASPGPSRPPGCHEIGQQFSEVLTVWSDMMNIAFLAHDKRKELMIQFCTAYKSILSKHSLYATATTDAWWRMPQGCPLLCCCPTSREVTNR